MRVGQSNEMKGTIDMVVENHDLGRFVQVRKVRGDRDQVFLVVPEGNRPEGWPAEIRVPELGSRTGYLTDPDYRARVLQDVHRLQDRLESRLEVDSYRNTPVKNLPKLAEIYYSRDVYTDLSESRIYKNRLNVEKILAWSSAREHPLVSTLTAMDVDDFQSIYAKSESTRYDMRSTWNMLFDTAIYAGWISLSPMRKGKWKTPKPKQSAVWTDEAVERHSAMARQMGQPGLAAMIVTMMEIGQRLGDMRTAKWGDEFIGDRFIIKQSKTSKNVNIPVPQKIRDLLQAVRVEGSPFVFNDFDTASGFSVSSLGQRFREVRRAVLKPGDDLLQLRGLRHACVCRLMGAGLPIAQIAAITGHLLGRVHYILERYFPDREGMAERGMRRVFEVTGAEGDVFGDVKPMLGSDREGAAHSVARYKEPVLTEANFERIFATATGQHRHRYALPGRLLWGDGDMYEEPGFP